MDDKDDDDDEVLEVPSLRKSLKARPSPFITTNNFGGGFVSDDDKVAISVLKYGSSESAGAQCHGIFDDEVTDIGIDGKLTDDEEQDLCVPLPPWALRAGARETIYMNPHDTVVASALYLQCDGLIQWFYDEIMFLLLISRPLL